MAGLKDFLTPQNGRIIKQRYQTLVGIADDNSPLMNRDSLKAPVASEPFSTVNTNIGVENSIGSIQITDSPYFESGQGINEDYHPFVVGDEAKYNNRKFGTNTYFGSNKDEPIGGLFNSPDNPYSLTFGNINEPTLDQIVTSGNLVTGEGYPAKKTVLNMISEANTVTPTKYLEGGQINIPGSSITNRALALEGIAIPNPIVNASISNNLARRQITLNPELTPSLLGEGDLANSQLAIQYKALLDPHRGNSGFRGNEPYQIFDEGGFTQVNLPAHGFGISGARQQSKNRGLAWDSAVIDANRLYKFLISPAGSQRLTNQAILRLQSVVVSAEYNESGKRVKTKRWTLSPENAVIESLAYIPGILGNRVGASIIMDRGLLGAINLANTVKAGIQKTINPSDSPDSISNLFGLHRKYESKITNTKVGLPQKTVGDSFLPKQSRNFFSTFTDLLSPKDKYDEEGDLITTRAGLVREKSISELKSEFSIDQLKNMEMRDHFHISKEFNKDDGSAGAARTKQLIDETYGAPFYFKDLRDNSIVVFRAYVKSLNENVNPKWTDTSFIGRSEPVYVYSNSTRNLSFTLTLHAGTKMELDSIYKKLNKLTSLCYPQYAQDKKIGTVRMKPPLVKFRYGDLYNSSFTPHDQGQMYTGLTGFIDSINYTYPDQGTWEIENGKQVPKLIDAAIKYNVIHDQPPHKGTKFYGYDHRIG